MQGACIGGEPARTRRLITRLADKVAIVTGAGQGIGRAIALAYGGEGARVMVAELRAHRVERTVAEITEGGGRAAGGGPRSSRSANQPQG